MLSVSKTFKYLSFVCSSVAERERDISRCARAINRILTLPLNTHTVRDVKDGYDRYLDKARFIEQCSVEEYDILCRTLYNLAEQHVRDGEKSNVYMDSFDDELHLANQTKMDIKAMDNYLRCNLSIYDYNRFVEYVV